MDNLLKFIDLMLNSIFRNAAIIAIFSILIFYGFNFLRNKSFQIPYASVFINQDSLIVISMDGMKGYSETILYDLKNSSSINISKGTIIEKCIPIYRNDTSILWSYDMKPNQKWAISNFRSNLIKWISEKGAMDFISKSTLLMNRPLMSENNYDPSKLPDVIFLSDEFQGVQYLIDNEGNAVYFGSKPVLIIRTGEINFESVNKFSKFHRHRILSFLLKKHYIGLYNENVRKFDWLIECSERSSRHHRTIYFDGVYKMNSSEVLLLVNGEIDKLDLKNGILKEFKKIL